MMNISQLRQFDKAVPAHIPRYITGPAGLGKSSVIAMMAKDRGYEVVDLRLSELEPGDLVGMPHVIQRADGRFETVYGAPSWWFDLERNHGKVYLFLDELDRASENMQPLAMQLTLDRRAGGRTLPKNVIIYAAGNGEKYSTAHLDQALINRMAVVEFSPTPEEWLAWASDSEASKVHPAIVEFIRAHRQFLDIPADKVGHPNVPVQSRRSWSKFGEVLWTDEDVRKNVVGLAADNLVMIWGSTFVGDTAASQLQSWIRDNYKPMSIDDLLDGKLKGKGKTFPITQVTQSLDEVFHRFRDQDMGPKVTAEQKINSAVFYNELGQEIFGQWLSRALPQDVAAVRTNPAVNKSLKNLMDAKKNFQKAAEKPVEAAATSEAKSDSDT